MDGLDDRARTATSAVLAAAEELWRRHELILASVRDCTWALQAANMAPVGCDDARHGTSALSCGRHCGVMATGRAALPEGQDGLAIAGATCDVTGLRDGQCLGTAFRVAAAFRQRRTTLLVFGRLSKAARCL